MKLNYNYLASTWRQQCKTFMEDIHTNPSSDISCLLISNCIICCYFSHFISHITNITSITSCIYVYGTSGCGKRMGSRLQDMVEWLIPLWTREVATGPLYTYYSHELDSFLLGCAYWLEIILIRVTPRKRV